ncbi:MAG: hypothetical protein K6G18_13045 [Treponema sp.]|nr:hypothetical protein [Treponema sp.]
MREFQTVDAKRIVSVEFPSSKVQPGEEILIYGHGRYGKIWAKQAEKTGFCTVLGFIDRNASTDEQDGSLPVWPPEKVQEFGNRRILIAVVNTDTRKEIAASLRRLGVCDGRIIDPSEDTPPLQSLTDSMTLPDRILEHIVVSLTTYPARFTSVCKTLRTLLCQTLRPDRIVVYLDCGEDEVTDEMRSFTAQGVEYRFGLENLKAHNKYFYAMQEFPESLVVTVDDDMLYPTDTVESLYRSYRLHPECVSARRVHRMLFDKTGGVLPYLEWFGSWTVVQPSHLLFATGVGGVLYPPHCIDGRVFNKELIKSVCLNNDDIWLKFMELLCGTKVVWVANSCPTPSIIEGSQDVGLQHINNGRRENDVQMANMFRLFGDEIAAVNRDFACEIRETYGGMRP